MASPMRFNPPPNWPAPPAGWVPPPGWLPDPAWGPPPEGWPLWTSGRANPRAWAYAFGVAGGLYLLSVVLGLVVTRGALSPETAGSSFARFALAGLFTALVARARPHRWSWWPYLVLVIGFAAALGALTTIGQAAGH